MLGMTCNSLCPCTVLSCISYLSFAITKYPKRRNTGWKVVLGLSLQIQAIMAGNGGQLVQAWLWKLECEIACWQKTNQEVETYKKTAQDHQRPLCPNWPPFSPLSRNIKDPFTSAGPPLPGGSYSPTLKTVQSLCLRHEPHLFMEIDLVNVLLVSLIY